MTKKFTKPTQSSAAKIEKTKPDKISKRTYFNPFTGRSEVKSKLNATDSKLKLTTPQKPSALSPSKRKAAYNKHLLVSGRKSSISPLNLKTKQNCGKTFRKNIQKHLDKSKKRKRDSFALKLQLVSMEGGENKRSQHDLKIIERIKERRQQRDKSQSFSRTQELKRKKSSKDLSIVHSKNAEELIEILHKEIYTPKKKSRKIR